MYLLDNKDEIDAIRKAATVIEMASMPEDRKGWNDFIPDKEVILEQIQIILRAGACIHGNYQAETGST